MLFPYGEMASRLTVNQAFRVRVQVGECGCGWAFVPQLVEGLRLERRQ